MAEGHAGVLPEGSFLSPALGFHPGRYGGWGCFLLGILPELGTRMVAYASFKVYVGPYSWTKAHPPLTDTWTQ